MTDDEFKDIVESFNAPAFKEQVDAINEAVFAGADGRCRIRDANKFHSKKVKYIIAK